MNLPRTLIATLLVVATVGVESTTGPWAANDAVAQTPTPQPAVQGAGVPAGGTRTFGGVTIVNQAAGDVTITLAEETLTVTSTVGAPFVLAAGSGPGCVVSTAGGITTARCPAPSGTTLTLTSDPRAAPAMALPRTGVGGPAEPRPAPGWALFGLGAAVTSVAFVYAAIRAGSRSPRAKR